MITLAEAKLHLRLIASLAEADSYTDEDSLIERIVRAAYLAAEQKTRLRIRQRSETLVLDGFPAGSGSIGLPWTPVQAVESLDYIDAGGEQQSLDAESLRLDTRTIYPRLAPQWGSRWPATISEPESVALVVTTGYQDVPEDIDAAVYLLIGHLYEHRESVVIGTISSDLPMGVGMLLGPHTIHAVG